MPSFSYLTGDGTLRNRLVLNAGTLADPDIALTSDTYTKASVDAMSAKLPTALGQQASTASLSVVVATGATLPITSPTYSAYASLGTSVNANIKATPGKMYGLVATNGNSSTQFIQLFNKVTAPINGDVPMRSYPVYGNYGSLMIDGNLWGLAGLTFSTGISWGMSSTPLAYTAISAATSVIFEGYYI